MNTGKLKNLISIAKNALKKGLFSIFGASVLANILGFIANTVIVRFISKAEYGIYSYANNQLTYFMLLSGLGAGSAILQMCSEIPDDNEKVKSIYNFGCKVGILSNLALALIILLYSYFVPLPVKGADMLLRLMCLLPLAKSLPNMQTGFMRSRLRNNDFAWSNIIKAVASCVFMIAGAYFFKAEGLIAGNYITAFLTTFLIALIFHVPIISKKHGTLLKETKKDFFKISLISMANNAISELLYLLDITIIAAIVGSEEVIASYKVATVIPTGLIFFPSALITFIYPYFARHKDDAVWVKKNYIYAILATFALDAVIAVILFIIAPWLLPFLFGANYTDAVLPFRILITGFAFSGTFRILSGNLLVTQRELKFNMVVAITSGIVNIIADIILIRVYGSVGAAIATVIVQLLSGIMNTSRMFYVLNKKAKQQIKKID